MRENRTHLRPTTFSATIGINPLHVFKSNVSLSGNTRIASDTRNRKTAMTSCVNKKKRGTEVEFKTHLLLNYCQIGDSGRRKGLGSYATTIWYP